MQLKISTLFWMFVIVVAAFGLYLVKYEVQGLKDQIVEAETKLRAEKEALHVIEAEWAYLNRPERLQALNVKYLDLTPMQGEAMVELEAVAFPAPVVASASPVTPASVSVTTALVQGGGDGE